MTTSFENLNAGDLEASVLEFETLLERDPNYSAAYFHGGQTLEKLGRLPPSFDRTSGQGSLTAGNSSPLTDGAVWRCRTRVGIAWRYRSRRPLIRSRDHSSFRIVPRPRFLVNSELPLLPNRSR